MRPRKSVLWSPDTSPAAGRPPSMPVSGKKRGGGRHVFKSGTTGVTIAGINGQEIRYMNTADAIKQRHVDPALITYHEQMGICFGRRPANMKMEFKNRRKTRAAVVIENAHLKYPPKIHPALLNNIPRIVMPNIKEISVRQPVHHFSVFSHRRILISRIMSVVAWYHFAFAISLALRYGHRRGDGSSE